MKTDTQKGLLADNQILKLLGNGMITPFESKSVSKVEGGIKIPSKGLSTIGYDIQLKNKWKTPVPKHEGWKDRGMSEFAVYDIFHPEFAPDYVDSEDVSYLLFPGHMVLSETVETFAMPDDVGAICVGKSTWARMGLLVNITPLEPGWKGVLTVEISNIGHIPIVVYPFVGIAQLLFLRTVKPTKTYAEKGSGKYQNQEGVTVAKL